MIVRAMRLAVLVLLVAVSAWAQPKPVTGVHVAAPLAGPTGLNCADATTRCVPSEYATIDACADAASAGNTCLISAGTYNEIITPANSGTSGNTITFVASGTVNVCGMDLSSESYLRFVGLQFNEGAGCSNRLRIIIVGGTNTGIEFWNSTFSNGGNGIGQTSLGDRCNQCLMIGNHFTALDAVDTEPGIFVQGTNLFMAYNEFDAIDADGFTGSWASSYLLNNYNHDIDLSDGAHADFFQTDAHDLGLQFNTIEANFHWGLGNGADEHVGVIQNLNSGQCQTTCGAVTQNVWRRNVWFNNSSGLGFSGAPVGTELNTQYYHNTEVDMSRMGSTTAYGTNWFGNVDFVRVRNNIAYEAWGTGITTNIVGWFIDPLTTQDFNYNLGYDPNGSVTFATAWNNQTGEQSNINPNFVDKANRNFTLGAGSGDGSNARGTAGPLTTTSGSGTGTTFNVASRGGGWFRGDNTNISQYGGALVVGDTITVGTDVVTVVSISTDAITVTPSFTWANGENVYLGSDTTPDIGAYPYKAGGYALSATYAGSGTITITPNDASLVRFVVCYSDGVPFAVDNASPYTCAQPAGTFSARVYPLYASQTLWAVATP